jgi:hypothetical protein
MVAETTSGELPAIGILLQRRTIALLTKLLPTPTAPPQCPHLTRGTKFSNSDININISNHNTGGTMASTL